MKADLNLLLFREKFVVIESGWRFWEIDLKPPPGCSEEDFVWPRIYICPNCQVVWARIQLPKKWDAHVYGISCLMCPVSTTGHLARQSVPGSLLYNNSCLEWEPDIDLQLLQALPKELLERELNLHIRAWENEQRQPYIEARRIGAEANIAAGFSRIINFTGA